MAASIIASIAVATPAIAKPRVGTVVAMEPIENRGDDEAESTKKKKGLGRALGTVGGLLGGSQIGGTAGSLVMRSGAVIGEKVAVAGDKPLPTQYMVKIKLDGGRTLNLSQYRVNLTGVSVGTRVSVDGTGSSARLTPAQ
jgi:outer membrane lipoprotein SlyB